ncbi:hypothetical protein AURDEDRAFT_159758 [Auricularia subglabra TFB-10046 SS5]|nr:hypothetical protein AURDEDRAFT_159758 [Auricularia subglabra TFB-10046 SS5]
MASSWAFIFELVLAIVEQSFFNEDLHPDYAALRTWALVCKSIAFDAQRLLFRDVRLATNGCLEAFLLATDPATPRGLELGNYVCRLALHSDLDGFSTALLRCPHLYELHVFFNQSYWRQLDAPTLEALRARSSTIKALAVTAGEKAALSDGTIDAYPLQLLAALPGIEFLSLHGAPALSRTMSTPRPPRLYELCWNVAVPWSEDDSVILGHINWLLLNSSDSLRVLRFGTAGTVSRLVFRALAERLGKRLHSLTLERRADRHVQSISLFPELRELVLGWVNGEDIGGLFAACPAAIQHLAIRGINAFNVRSLVDVARSSRDIRCISYFHAECNIDNLRVACRERGVVLRRCEHFPPVRASLVLQAIAFTDFEQRVQPLRVPDFPRSLHVDNFKAMLPA